jgi:hypothetical protein
MEPLNDDELNQILNQWEAPAKPRSLRRKVFARKPSLWRRLWTSSFRIPFPVAIGVALLVVLWLRYSSTSKPAAISRSTPVTLAGFEPVRRLQPTFYSGGPQ